MKIAKKQRNIVLIVLVLAGLLLFANFNNLSVLNFQNDITNAEVIVSSETPQYIEYKVSWSGSLSPPSSFSNIGTFEFSVKNPETRDFVARPEGSLENTWINAMVNFNSQAIVIENFQSDLSESVEKQIVMTRSQCRLEQKPQSGVNPALLI